MAATDTVIHIIDQNGTLKFSLLRNIFLNDVALILDTIVFVNPKTRQ